jgi:hypothetical protein
MCRPIGAAASLLRQTCKQLNIRSDGDAGAKALAFSLRKDKSEFVFLRRGL